jgi:FAD/FMN-containing dehydrogenase
MDRRSFLTHAGVAALALSAPPVAARARGRTDARLRELAGAMRGPVLRRGAAGYESARRVYNERYDGLRPLAVAQPADVADVRAAVRWSARHGIPLALRSGGHSYAGYSTTGSGVQLDLRRLRGITVRRASGTVIVGAGAQLVDVYAALAAAGGTIPAGSCPNVGIAGLALGGGHGLASRRLGLTADNVVGLTIVTADGRLLTIDRRRHPDLFWACRGGGGGQFGVVTSLTLRVTRVRSASYFFASWPWDDAAAAVAAWQRFAPDAPDELMSVLTLATGEEQPTVRALGQWWGGEAALQRALGPLRATGARITTGQEAYGRLMLRWAGCLDLGAERCRIAPSGALRRARFAAKSHYVSRNLSAAGIRALLTAAERRQATRGDGSGALLLDAYGGAINRVDPDATAFVHRDQRFSVQELAYWGEDGAPALAWLRRTHAALAPHASGQAYLNYTDPELQAWRRAWFGSNLDRLVAVKRRYDPDRVFRFRQGL